MADFEFGLFGCLNDIGTSCKTCLCICCTISENSARLDGNQNICMCCYPASPYKNRAQAKARFGFGAPTCGDCLIAMCCACCSEIQIAQEIEKRKIQGYSGPATQTM